jgi:hypothetical protein
MSGRTRRRAAWSAAALLSLAAAASVAIVAVSSAGAGSRTVPLQGKMQNIIQHFGCADSPIGVCSTFNAIGSFNGDGFVVVDTFPDQNNFGFSKAHTVIHTSKGDLHCHEAALFSAPGADGIASFVDMCLIDADGTGLYAGASGYIQESGTFDFFATPPVGNLTYQGSLTLAG